MHSSEPVRPPPELSRLLSASEGSEQDEAWAAFLALHTRLLLHVCRTVMRDRDAAMDGYASVLEDLRADDYRRLRAYRPRSTSQFTTWLVVVTRRLLLDYRRQRYGRSRSDDEARQEGQAARRLLEDLIGSEVDPDQLPIDGSRSADADVGRRELSSALQQTLTELSPPDRLLLALRFEDERPVKEIAAIMRLPTVFHVYRRLEKVLSELKRALARRGVDAAEP